MASTDAPVVPDLVSFTKAWHSAAYDAISPLRPELSATGKNVVVTGGGTGIGKAIATAFSQAGAASVSILGRREDRLKTSLASMTGVKNARTKLQYEVADLCKREEIERAFSNITAKVGKIDVYVSNAGVLPTPGAVATIDPGEFLYGWNINVMGALNGAQVFLSHAAPNAILLSISTGIAHFAPMPGMSAYAATKVANTKMMDYFAAENPSLHVVNVQPGVVSTEMNDGNDSIVAQDECMYQHEVIISWLYMLTE